MKKLLFSALLLVLFVASADAGKKYFPTSDNGKVQSMVSSTFGANVVDTVIWIREPGVTAATFGVYAADTLDISATTKIVRMVKDGPLTAITADTLASAEALAITDYLAPATSLDALTLSPLAEQYWFVLTYHSTSCGTGTANVVRYYLHKQYAK